MIGVILVKVAGICLRAVCRARGKILFLIVAIFMFPVSVSATPTASDLDKIQREQDQLLRLEEERRRERERLRKLKELTPPQKEDKPEIQPEQDTDRCIQVNSIRLLGAEILDPSDLQVITSDYENSCLNIGQLEELLQKLNDLFRDAGFVTSRAYLPEQDMRDGILEIRVLQGRVEALTLGENGSPERRQLYFAFPLAEGEVLNLRDIEQGLEQMNRLASNDAKMTIEPGQEAGTSIIAVQNQTSRQFRIEMGRDNSGTNSTGTLKNTANIFVDNVLSLNDSWGFYFSDNARGFNQTRRSTSATGTLTIPFGYSTLSYSSSYYGYKTLVEGEVQSFTTTGLSTTDALELSHILHRDQSSKTRMDVGLTRKKSRNFLDDVRLDSSRNLSIGHLALAHSRRVLEGVLSTEIRHERGLRLLHAKEDEPDQDSAAEKAQFRKWILEASYSRPFKLTKNANLTWSSSTSWQYAPDNLFGTEQIGVGGQYSVRGFREDTLSGDTGGYWRNEFSLTGIKQDWGLFDPVVGTLTPYLAYDWGWIRKDRSNAREKGALAGWTAGLRNDAKYFRFDIQYSQAVSAPEFLDKESHEFNFSAKLLF